MTPLDIRSMTPAIRGILTNRAVIAIDQDPPGAEATGRTPTAR